MAKGDNVKNRSDHAAACPQVFREFPEMPKAVVAPKKSKKKKEVVEEVAEDVVEDVVEEVASDGDES